MPNSHESACANCGEHIVLVRYAMGIEEWTHQPAGASFQDGQHRYCHKTIAVPGPLTALNPAQWPKTMEQLNAVWHEGHKAGYDQAIREMQSTQAEEARSPYDITTQQHNNAVARRQPGGI